MYTKPELGKELLEVLKFEPYDSDNIANWAEGIHNSYCRELSNEVYDVIEDLCLMSMGPEFESTKEELLMLADMLIKNEENIVIRFRKLILQLRGITYTKPELGNDLKEILKKEPYDPDYIAAWAEGIHQSLGPKISNEANAVIEELSLMSKGLQFKRTKEELLILTDMLINDEEKIIEKFYKLIS